MTSVTPSPTTPWSWLHVEIIFFISNNEYILYADYKFRNITKVFDVPNELIISIMMFMAGLQHTL